MYTKAADRGKKRGALPATRRNQTYRARVLAVALLRAKNWAAGRGTMNACTNERKTKK